MSSLPRVGALVISLDFELHWGLHDIHPPHGAYRENLLGARDAIPRILDRFARSEIGATWATVGLLFARDRDEREAFEPELRPSYSDPRFDSYRVPVGRNELDDPFHYAASLVERIAKTPRQEVASHTFSHYYCLERGQTKEQFASDLRAAGAIARAHGVTLRSLVLPRNQLNPAYASVLREVGMSCYRGNERSWMYRARPGEGEHWSRRAARLADAYVDLTGPNVTAWSELATADGLIDVPSSRFLRPYSGRLARLEEPRLRRIEASLEAAAREGKVMHLWWHPHNFGAHTAENLKVLDRVLGAYERLRDRYGMLSLSMADAAERVRSPAAA